ncbi:MAG: histidine phosphatase family protein [Candidatus Methanofastidiosa archaeon]|nr:histidine phosphatase family protein [Candidatus Methanofastidiosa archaeon]
MAKIYLLRHARVDANMQNRLCGWSDPETSLKGLKELRSLMLPKADITFCSPMSRCRATADALGIRKYTISELLKEVNFGAWEMQSFDELYKKCPESVETYLSSPYEFRFPEGESIDDVRERVKSFISEVLEPHLQNGKDILIIGHSGSLRLLLMELMGLDMAFFWKIGIEPAALTAMRYQTESSGLHFFLERMNCQR